MIHSVSFPSSPAAIPTSILADFPLCYHVTLQQQLKDVLPVRMSKVWPVGRFECRSSAKDSGRASAKTEVGVWDGRALVGGRSCPLWPAATAACDRHCALLPACRLTQGLGSAHPAHPQASLTPQQSGGPPKFHHMPGLILCVSD